MIRRIDLRSDTVTQPTPEMREAIYRAEVGDDIMRDDPTVLRLEDMAAALFDKPAALFLPSGTMANQVAVMTYTERGDEILLGDTSHLYNLESGALGALCQVQTRTFSLENQRYSAEKIEQLIRPSGLQEPKTALICLENTCNLNAGLVIESDNINQVAQVAGQYDIPLFLDGARIFNAAVALNQPVSHLAAEVDSVMFALTKGLAAPFGAVLVGRREWIDRARRNKQRLGGGFRQAGFMAAAGIVALETMIPRLAEDHANAKLLGRAIAQLPGLSVDLAQLHTNIVAVSGETSAQLDHLVAQLAAEDILVKRIAPRSIRMVTHYGIDQAAIERVIAVFGKIMEASQDEK